MRIIIGKGEDAFDLFVKALQEEKEHLGHGSLAKRLLSEQRRLIAGETKSRAPEPLPRNKKLPTSAPTPPPKPNVKPQTQGTHVCIILFSF